MIFSKNEFWEPTISTFLSYTCLKEAFKQPLNNVFDDYEVT